MVLRLVIPESRWSAKQDVPVHDVAVAVNESWHTSTPSWALADGLSYQIGNQPRSAIS